MELFTVSPSCRKAGLRSRAILFRGVSIRPSPPGFPEQVRRVAEDLRSRFPTPRSVRETAAMAELHSIFRKVGVNPRKLQPSCERLVQLVLKRGAIPAINNLVDTYNLVSLRWNCSLGAHDLDRLVPPVQLRFLNGDETFVPLGSREAGAFRKRGEFGYVDARESLDLPSGRASGRLQQDHVRNRQRAAHRGRHPRPGRSGLGPESWPRPSTGSRRPVEATVKSWRSGAFGFPSCGCPPRIPPEIGTVR